MIYWRRAKRTRLHDSMRTISDSWYRASGELQCMHGFGTELIRNLAIWLAVSQDYHLFICKVYWYILSMFVPIFTSFGIENSSLHCGRPRKLLPLISLSYFFLFHFPRVSTRGIASNHNKPYRHWRQDGGWHALPIVTHATAWRRELLFYTSRRQGQPLQFRARNPRSHVIMRCMHPTMRTSRVMLKTL